MNKFLRHALFLVLALMGTTAFAQEVTLDFTTNDWGIPTSKTTEAASYTSNGYTITLSATTAYYFSSSSYGSYLMLGKKGSTLTLPTFNFDVERIDVIGNSNASGQVTQNFYVDDVAVSTETSGAKGTNYYVIADDYQVAGTNYTLKVTSAQNTQISKILIWKKGTAPALSIPDVDNIAAFNQLEDGTKARLHLNNVKVTYANADKNVVYLRDATGGLCLKNQTGVSDMENTWTLGGYIVGSVNDNQGMPQINVDSTDQITHTVGDAYEPVTIDTTEASKHIADLVTINGFPITKVGNYFYNNANKDIQIYDSFGIGYTVEDSDTVNVTGVMTIYNTNLEIVPTEAPTVVSTGISLVTANADDKNAPSYSLTGQRVGPDYKGIIIRNGKKLIRRN